MASSIYFFTDVEINPQDETQAFGPVSTSPADKYRVTSIHSASHDPKAIAIVDGSIVAVKDLDDSSLITLVLKPKNQISEITGLRFPSIKYILYKGILKSSLIRTNGSAEIISGPLENNLAKKLNQTQDLINREKEKISEPPLVAGSITDLPSAKLLKLDPSIVLSPETNIDILFYRPENVLFESPSVLGGWHIGDFDGKKFGIEIIFDDVRTESLVKNAQHVETLIIPPTSEATTEDRFNRKTKKEEVLNYMDLCAFYGSLYAFKKIKYIKKIAKVELDPNDSDFIETQDFGDIYNKILVPIFKNKNVVYIDIRNEFNRSFNYLENYKNDIKLKSGTKNYYELWPILTVSDVNSYELESNFDKDFNILELEIPVSENKKENKDPFLYISNGYIKGRKFPEELVGVKKFINTRNKINGFLKPLELVFPNWIIPGATSGSTLPISFYSRIKYLKNGKSESSDTDLVHRSVEYIDNIFLPFKMTVPFDSSKTKDRVYNEEVYIRTGRFSFSASVGIAVDSINTTLFAFAKDVNSSRNTTPVSLVSEISNKSHFLSHVADKYNNIDGSRPFLTSPTSKLVKGSFNLGTIANPIIQNYVRFINTSPFFPVPITSINPQLEEEFISIVLKTSSYVDMAINHDLDRNFDVFVILSNKQKVEIGNKKFPLYSYDLKLMGYKSDGGNLTLQESELPPLVVYGYKDGNKEPLIFIEKGADVDLDTPEDDAQDCTETVLSNAEITRLESFISELDSNPTNFQPNEDLYKAVFSDSAGKGFKIISGALDYDRTTPPTMGFLAETAYLFAMWSFAKDLLEVDALDNPKPDIYLKLREVLIRNGFVEPDNNTEENEIINILRSDLPIGITIGNAYFQFRDYITPVGDAPERPNIKENIYYLMKKGNWEGGAGESKRFIFPNQPANLNDLKILEHIDAILKDVSSASSIAIRKLAGCVFNAFISKLEEENLLENIPEKPESLLLATGDGSTTTGLLNDSNINNLGAVLFSYNYIDLNKSKNHYGKVARANIKEFKPRKDLQTVVHLSLFGLDDQPVLVDVIITDSFGRSKICRFNATPGTNLNKLYPVNSLNNTPVQNSPLQGFDNSLTNGTIPDNIGRFFDSSNNEIARYDENTNDLQISSSINNANILVELVSGGSEAPNGVGGYEEVQLMVCVVDGKPQKKSFVLETENVYPQDKFELKKTDKENLLEQTNVQDNIDALVEALIVGISSQNINIKLKAQNVGKLIDGPTGGSNLKRDTCYGFGLNRPVSEPDNPQDYGVPTNCLNNIRILETPEVPAGLIDLYKKLQYSFADVEFDNDSLDITIESFVSPIWSRLDNKIPDNYTGGTNAYLAKLDGYTLYGTNANHAKKPYIRVAVASPPNPAPYVFKPSYNPVLSALRCYGLLDGIRSIILKRAQVLGKTPTEIATITSKIDSAIDAIFIPSNEEIGISTVVDNEVFFGSDGINFKWYESPADKALYGDL
ncbi:MAG: hypothetical protein ACT4ON_00975 [Bacteroidota bacterium]